MHTAIAENKELIYPIQQSHDLLHAHDIVSSALPEPLPGIQDLVRGGFPGMPGERAMRG